MPYIQGTFTHFTVPELVAWLDEQTVTRTITHVQQHHTFSPGYAHFKGNDHFRLQAGMEREHIETNGWGGIGQHFSIFPDGAVVTGRPLNSNPICILKANSGGICIENVGNFDVGKDTMKPAQRQAILRVTAALLIRFPQIPRNDTGIVYHHWFDLNGHRSTAGHPQKTCPGTGFFGGNKVAAFNANFLPQVLKELAGPPPRAGTATPPGTQRRVLVTSASLNVRRGPGVAYEFVPGRKTLTAGSVVRVWAETDGWLRISETHHEWVNGRLTKPLRRAVVSEPNSNVRDRPALDGAIKAVLQPSQVVHVIATLAGWARLDTNQWIHLSLIKLD